MRNRLNRRSRRDLAALLHAAGGRPSAREVAGLPIAQDAYRSAMSAGMAAPAVTSRRAGVRARVTAKIVKVAIAVIGLAFAGGVSYAAASGGLDWLLPSSIESPAVPSAEPGALSPGSPSGERQPQHAAASSATANNAQDARPSTPTATTSPAPAAMPPATMASAPRTTAPDPGGVAPAEITTQEAIGAIAPQSVDPVRPDAGTSSDTAADATPSTASRGPDSAALPGLCTAWRAQQATGKAHGASAHTPAAAVLATAAGGQDNIGAFCDDLVGPATTGTASPNAPTSATTAADPPGNSGDKSNGNGAGAAGGPGNGNGTGQGNGNGNVTGQGNGNGVGAAGGPGNGNGLVAAGGTSNGNGSSNSTGAQSGSSNSDGAGNGNRNGGR